MPVHQEVNIIATIEYALCNLKNVYLPRAKGNILQFVETDSLDALKPGAFMIGEPQGEAVAYDQIDLVFVPLTSYDLDFNRTGYGKGYYDSILSKIRCKTGIGFSEQMVDHLETEAHAIRLDTVIHA